jgi:streptogramin lyase
LRFDPRTEKFEPFPLPDRSAGVRACDGVKARGPLLNIAGGVAAGQVATGAPLLGELAALGGIRQRGLHGQLAGRKGEVWGAESGADRLFVLKAE